MDAIAFNYIQTNKLSDQDKLWIALFEGDLDCVKRLIDSPNLVFSKSTLTPLHIAADLGHLDIVKYLLELNCKVDALSWSGETPLIFAAKNGHTAVVRLLIASKSNPLHMTKYMKSALYAACSGSHLETVKFLIEEGGCDLSTHISTSPNAINHAAWGGNVQILKYLISIGFPNVNRGTETSLHVAASSGKLDAVRFLIKNGSNSQKEQLDNQGFTPIQVASRRGNWDVVKYLVSIGCDYLAINRFQVSAFSFACAQNNLNMLKYFHLNLGCDLNQAFHIGSTLQEICRNGHIEILKYFFENGVSFQNEGSTTNKDEELNTIKWSCEGGQLDFVKYLVSIGCNIANRAEPLIHACLSENLDLVKYLVSIGADKNKADGNGLSPIQTAAKFGRLDMLQYLIWIGCDLTSDGTTTILHLAVESGNLNMVKFLIENTYFWKNERIMNGNTALHIASSKGKLEVVKYLIYIGYDLNQRNYESMSPLDLASSEGHLHIVKYFVSTRINFHGDGNSALWWACRSGHLEIVQYLVLIGANVLRDKGTCLSAAAHSGNLDLVKFLIENGADSLLDLHNFANAAFFATREGHLDILNYLIELGCNFEHCFAEACADGYLNIVQHFIESGQTTSLLDLQKSTIGGHIHVLKYFHSIGIELGKIIDIGGKTILFCAIEQGDLTIVKFLVEIGMDFKHRTQDGRTPLLEACAYGHVEILKYLHSIGSDLYDMDSQQRTSLELASESGKIEVVRYLIRNGVEETASEPVQIAVQCGFLDIVQYFVQKIVEVDDVISDNGETLFWIACDFNRLDIAEYLHTQGADINSRDNNDTTAIFQACADGELSRVKFLVEIGCDRNLETDGCTPMQIAKRRFHQDVVNYLKSVKRMELDNLKSELQRTTSELQISKHELQVAKSEWQLELNTTKQELKQTKEMMEQMFYQMEQIKKIVGIDGNDASPIEQGRNQNDVMITIVEESNNEQERQSKRQKLN